jgi:uncharacterized protein
MTLRADEVAHYLQSNPKFFEDYADLVAQMVIPHPHSGRAISITERQMLALRDRNRTLEGKLSELIQFGEDNDTIGERMQRLCVSLIGAESLFAALRATHYQLREDFLVPHVALCLWDRPAALAEIPAYVVIDDTLQVLGETLTRAYCGSTHGFESVRWFGEAADGIKSQALVAMKCGDETVGMLAMGSEDANRFFSDMGTIYLDRIGQQLSAALERTLRAR